MTTTHGPDYHPCYNPAETSPAIRFNGGFWDAIHDRVSGPFGNPGRFNDPTFRADHPAYVAGYEAGRRVSDADARTYHRNGSHRTDAIDAATIDAFCDAADRARIVRAERSVSARRQTCGRCTYCGWRVRTIRGRGAA